MSNSNRSLSSRPFGGEFRAGLGGRRSHGLVVHACDRSRASGSRPSTRVEARARGGGLSLSRGFAARLGASAFGRCVCLIKFVRVPDASARERGYLVALARTRCGCRGVEVPRVMGCRARAVQAFALRGSRRRRGASRRSSASCSAARACRGTEPQIAK